MSACKTCRYFGVSDDQEREWGTERPCKRHAPTVHHLVTTDRYEAEKGRPKWPWVQPTDWCGDFEQYTAVG